MTTTTTKNQTIKINLPRLHEAQQEVVDESSRFNVLSCGRRWGKTQLGVNRLTNAALRGEMCAWFAPTYKFLEEAWDAFTDALKSLGPLVQSNKTERVIKLGTEGRIDFWTLERPNAGRGRKYHEVAIDEAAIVRELMNYFFESIRPTLTDFQGRAWFLSTPFGMNDFHKLWIKGQNGESGWASWQMPTRKNPFILLEEIEAAKNDIPEDAFNQEYLALFLADASNPFGIDAIRACLVDDLAEGPVEYWGFDLAKATDNTVGIGLNRDGHVCAFQRWKTDWRNTVARVAGMVGSTPALIDSTGVGDPIVEQLQSVCPNVEGFKFSRQSKQQLFEGLAVAIQHKEVTFPRNGDARIIANELETFQYVYHASGVRYDCPRGMHDDAVDALALAWRARQIAPGPPKLTVMSANEINEQWMEGWGWLNPFNDAIWEEYN